MENQPKVSLSDISLYEIVRRYIEAFPSPVPGIVLDVDRYPDSLGIYTIWTYKDQTRDLPTRKQQDLALWLADMKNFINSAIIENVAVQLDEKERAYGT
jgi:hypothetical protein